MTSRKLLKNSIVMLLLMIFLLSSASYAYAATDGYVQNVIIDNVLWPAEGVQIPKFENETIYSSSGNNISFSTEGLTDEQIYNRSTFIKLLPDSEYKIEDAYWMFRPAGSDDSFQQVYSGSNENGTVTFSTDYEYKIRVVLYSQYSFDKVHFSEDKMSLLAYFDYYKSAKNGYNDMSYFDTFVYNDENNEYDLKNNYLRFDILFNSKAEGENPFIELSRVRAVDCSSYGEKNGKLVGVTDRMTVTSSMLAEPITGSSSEGETITGLAAGTYKVTSVYNPNRYVTLTVSQPSKPEASIKDITLPNAVCGYDPDDYVREVVITNNSETDEIKIKKSDVTVGEGFELVFAENFPSDGITLKANQSTEGTGYIKIKPVSGLHGTSASATVKAVYSYGDPSSTSETTGGKVSFTVSHTYNFKQNGWCEKCGTYKSDFNGTIVSGNRRTYYINFWPVFKVDIKYQSNNSVLVDGAVISAENYTAEYDESTGYTKITLQNSFIRTLQPGRHTIKFVFTDKDGKSHSASGYFRLSSATGVYTGDENQLTRAVVLIAVSLVGIWTVIFISLKKKLAK